MRTLTIPSALRRVAVGVAMLLAAGLAGFGGSALAGGGQSFSDVSPGHPFYDEIEWLAHAGITTGYPDGTFRPGAPVTRQAMAAYLERVNAGISTHESQSFFNDSRTLWYADAFCPTGKRAIAGGGYTNAEDVLLFSSYSLGGGSWQLGFAVPPGVAAKADVTVTVFVTCVPETQAG